MLECRPIIWEKEEEGLWYLGDCILLSLELLLPWTYLRRVERIAIRDVKVKIKCSTCNKEERNEQHCYIRCETLLRNIA